MMPIYSQGEFIKTEFKQRYAALRDKGEEKMKIKQQDYLMKQIRMQLI